MIDRYLLRYFLAVVDEGNFSLAALASNISQPTLSVGIAKLERLLDTRLFERSNQRVTLTDSGRRLLARARRIEQEFNLAVADMTGGEPSRPARIGILSTLPTAMIEAIAHAYRRAGGAEPFELIDGGERELINRLDRGRLDAALTLLRPDLDRFTPALLYTEDYVLMLRADHRLAREPLLDPTALAGETMIVRRHCEALAATSRYFVERSIRPHFSVRTTSDDRAVAMVRAGAGVTVMPERFVSPGISAVHLAGFTLSRQVALLYADHAQALRQGHGGIIRAIRSTIGGGS